MSAPLSDLRKATVRQQKRTTSVRITAGGKVEQELDIRGKRVQEALDITEQYLSDALFYGWHEVRIIHGTAKAPARRCDGCSTAAFGGAGGYHRKVRLIFAGDVLIYE